MLEVHRGAASPGIIELSQVAKTEEKALPASEVDGLWKSRRDHAHKLGDRCRRRRRGCRHEKDGLKIRKRSQETEVQVKPSHRPSPNLATSAKAKKKPYHAPRLTVYGGPAEMTRVARSSQANLDRKLLS